MEVLEYMQAYITSKKYENQNLYNAAYEELNASQYEEAAKHFDEIFVKDSSDYMSFYLRAYCKCHLGRRGDVLSSAQTFSYAFDAVVPKIFSSQDDIEINLGLVVNLYYDAMECLEYNAINRPYEIRLKMLEHLTQMVKNNLSSIKGVDEVRNDIANIYKNSEKYFWHNDDFQKMLYELDSDYEELCRKKSERQKQEELMNRAKRRKTNLIIWLIVIVVTIFIVVCCAAAIKNSQ